MFCKNSYLTHFSATVSKFFPKNFLHFLKKGPPNSQETGLFLYSEPWHNKTFLHFWKWSFPTLYFSYISGSNFPSSKNEKNPLLKCFLYFGEMELSSSKLKNLLTFQEVTCKPENQNVLYYFSNLSTKDTFL